MKILNNSFVLAILFAFGFQANAQIKIDERNASVFTSDHLTQIVIQGSAAASLYKDLATREGVEEFACGDGKAIAVSPFLCMKKDGSTICLSNLFPSNERFETPDSCDGPNPSVIGAGNIPPSIKLRPQQDTLRSQL